jgi:hypothetical protein
MPRGLTRWPNAIEMPLGPSPVSSGVRQHVTRLTKRELADSGVSKSTRQIIPHFSLLVRAELLSRHLDFSAWSDMADMHSDSNVGSDASTVSLVGTRGGKLGTGFVIVSAWPVAATAHVPMATIIRTEAFKRLGAVALTAAQRSFAKWNLRNAQASPASFRLRRLVFFQVPKLL